MEKIFVFYLILLLLVITVTLFTSLYEINENELTSYRMSSMGVTFLVSVAVLYNICDDAHYISYVVRLY
jgi:hypothetical protein